MEKLAPEHEAMTDDELPPGPRGRKSGSTNELLKPTSVSSSLDHPCKETCSGWQQGYERGSQAMEELRNEIDLLREEIAKLREATDIAIQIHNEDEREKEDLRNALTAALLRAQGAEKALGNMRAERDKLQVQINGIVQ